MLGGMVLILGLVMFFMKSEQLRRSEDLRLEEARKATAAFLPKHDLSADELGTRRRELLTKFEGALSDTDNGSELTEQSSGFLKLLEVVAKYSPEEVDERARLEFDYDAVMKDPDALRGEFVRARGVIMQAPQAVKLRQPVLGREDFYRGFMTDDTNFYVVDMLDRPAGMEAQRTFDLTGVFYRTVSYVGGDNQRKVLPLLIVRDMKRVEADPEPTWRTWMSEHVVLILAGMAVLVFGGRLLFSLVLANRRPQARREPAMSGSFQEMFDRQLRAAGKEPPPPTATPPGKSDGH